MNPDADLLALEKNFWTSGPSFYEQHLAADATMLFPAGVLQREKIIAAVAEAPRWVRIRINDPYVARPSKTVAVLTYRADAARRGQQRYAAQVTSVYALGVDGWRLVFHQQVPDEATSRAIGGRSAARLKASAIGATALGALATGALAIGALAIGRLAIGALVVGRARLRSLTIDDLTIRRVRLPDTAG